MAGRTGALYPNVPESGQSPSSRIGRVNRYPQGPAGRFLKAGFPWFPPPPAHCSHNPGFPTDPNDLGTNLRLKRGNPRWLSPGHL